MARNGTLEISFYGPFFFDMRREVRDKCYVAVYAPKCPGHKAGIFSAKAEAPLRGRRRSGDALIYNLSGDVFLKPDLTDPPTFDTHLGYLNISGKGNPSCKAAHFCLHLPVPKYVYPINGSPPVEVVQQAVPTGAYLNQYATGLRFYYDADLDGTLLASCSGKSIGFNSPFDNILNLPVADVYVRYSGTTPEDPDHEDAIQCFDLIANLCGLDWWLCYEDWNKTGLPHEFVRGGDDCRAPIMVAI